MRREFRDRRQLAVTVLGRSEDESVGVRNDQRDQLVSVWQADAANAGGRATHATDILFREADGFAAGAAEHDIVEAAGNGHADELVAFVQADRDDSRRTRPRERGKRSLLDRAAGRGHEHVKAFFEFADGQDSRNALTLAQRQQVHDGLAARSSARLRQSVYLQPVQLATTGEAQKSVVSIGNEQRLDEVFILDRGGRLAATATPLGAVFAHRLRLGVAAMGKSHHDILWRDEVLDRQV